MKNIAKIFWILLISLLSINFYAYWEAPYFNQNNYDELVNEFWFSGSQNQIQYLDNFILWNWTGQINILYDSFNLINEDIFTNWTGQINVVKNYKNKFNFEEITVSEFHNIYDISEQYNRVKLYPLFSNEEVSRLSDIFYWWTIDFDNATIGQIKSSYYLFLWVEYKTFKDDLIKISEWIWKLNYIQDKMWRSWGWAIWTNIYCINNIWEDFDENWISCNYSKINSKINKIRREILNLQSNIITSMIRIKWQASSHIKSLYSSTWWTWTDLSNAKRGVCWPWKTYDLVNETCIIAPVWYWNDWRFIMAQKCYNWTINATEVKYLEEWVKNSECPFEITQCKSWYSSVLWNCVLDEQVYIWKSWEWSNCIEIWLLTDYWYWNVSREISCYEKIWETQTLVDNSNCEIETKPIELFYCKVSAWNCLEFDENWLNCTKYKW